MDPDRNRSRSVGRSGARSVWRGGRVFIPAYSWVDMKVTGSDAVGLVAIFSAPGFENHLRCAAVPANEKPTPMTLADWRQCDHEGHVVYKDRGEEAPGTEAWLTNDPVVRKNQQIKTKCSPERCHDQKLTILFLAVLASTLLPDGADWKIEQCALSINRQPG
jgi:hypothetical protein